MPRPTPSPGVRRRARALARPGPGGIRSKLKRLWGRKIAGVPAPIVGAGVLIGGYIVWRARQREAAEEGVSDFSAGVGDEGPISSGVGGVSDGGDGGVIGLPRDFEFPFPPDGGFLPGIFEIPRGKRRRRPRGSSREQVNRSALRDARRRALAREARERKERRQIIRRRIERQRTERRQLRRRIESRRAEHTTTAPRFGGRGPGPQPTRLPPARSEERRRRRRDRFRPL